MAELASGKGTEFAVVISSLLFHQQRWKFA
jgi:stress response protein SCP2